LSKKLGSLEHFGVLDIRHDIRGTLHLLKTLTIYTHKMNT